MIPENMDIEAFVLSVDPDWNDHFVCIDQAFDHYWKYLGHKERMSAVREAWGGELNHQQELEHQEQENGS